MPYYPLTCLGASVFLCNYYLQMVGWCPLIVIVVLCGVPFVPLCWWIQNKWPGKILWGYIPLSFIMCILWLNAPADQVVESLTFVAEHMQWNMVLLAVTVIAIGNSLSGKLFLGFWVNFFRLLHGY